MAGSRIRVPMRVFLSPGPCGCHAFVCLSRFCVCFVLIPEKAERDHVDEEVSLVLVSGHVHACECVRPNLRFSIRLCWLCGECFCVEDAPGLQV